MVMTTKVFVRMKLKEDDEMVAVFQSATKVRRSRIFSKQNMQLKVEDLQVRQSYIYGMTSMYFFGAEKRMEKEYIEVIYTDRGGFSIR